MQKEEPMRNYDLFRFNWKENKNVSHFIYKISQNQQAVAVEEAWFLMQMLIYQIIFNFKVI